jgi:hypothetical protein
MDVIFDIDGTLADATHRLHFIKDTAHWVSKPGRLPGPDWDTFLSDEQVAKDAPIAPIWGAMNALLRTGHRILFITGRKESTRAMTTEWLLDWSCPVRRHAAIRLRPVPNITPSIYMRSDGDRRPSEVVKEEGLMRARADGFNPVMVFEDRDTDTAMWRRNGLLCCQVADGSY